VQACCKTFSSIRRQRSLPKCSSYREVSCNSCSSRDVHWKISGRPPIPISYFGKHMCTIFNSFKCLIRFEIAHQDHNRRSLILKCRRAAFYHKMWYINCRPFEFGKADIYIPLEDEDVLICEIKRRQTDSVDHIFLRSKLVSNSAP
jgi:hypothetical protein